MDHLCLTGGFIYDSGRPVETSCSNFSLQTGQLCAQRDEFVLIKTKNKQKKKKAPSEKADGLLDTSSDISHVKTIFKKKKTGMVTRSSRFVFLGSGGCLEAVNHHGRIIHLEPASFCGCCCCNCV